MSATYNLFKRWKAQKNFKSDRQAALALGISAQAVNVWKDGANGEPEYIVKMANELGESPVRTVLEAYAEQKKGDSAKVLMKLSKQFGVIAVVLITGFFAIAPQTAQASVESISHIPLWNVYYVKVKRALRRMASFWSMLCTHRQLMHHHA
jgi:hypothetical protein